ncbi:interferon-stimulated 20 kDa exonuclease-like 2 [Eublepharis macularius]|uniref:Interferon-stimulated 20 kDa exonuclease-like 2 n=1 Tax=Eublepharis macularius TaxID=481883 RepID=A0AA97KE84_EUBMA|nr:interferon-stimulated 20 kDa exonuclease-like 2 [Eublepharis macularius]
MSDIVIHVDTALQPRPSRGSEGSRKHKRFVRRRRVLEKKGCLKQKQRPPQPAQPKQEAAQRRSRPTHRGRRRRRRKTGGPGGAGAENGVGRWLGTPSPTENGGGGGGGGGRRTPGLAAWAQPGGLPAAPSKAGSRSAKPGGVKHHCSTRDRARASLWSECESGLPSAPSLATPSKMVAVDCEMVGTGPGGRISDLARCSIVNYYGDVMYDKYIRPVNPITNYRTKWSGIRRHHMTNAVPFKTAQKEILKILTGKIVIGHAIHNDFKALKYFHPKSATRDTSKIPLLNRKAGFPENESASLKRLTKQLLHRDIQVGQNGHSSVEDARATMELYKVVEVDWESYLASSPAQD